MKEIIKVLGLVFSLFIVGGSVCYAQDYTQAIEAYKRKDYDAVKSNPEFRNYRYLLGARDNSVGSANFNAVEPTDAEAQYYFGMMFSEDTVLEADERFAVKYSRLAAKQGHVGAQARLGSHYLSGSGVIKDEEEGMRLLRSAAEQGDGYANATLGAEYSKKEDITKRDYKEAAKFYQVAAEKGDLEAQSYLGSAYEDGRGVTQNHDEAVKWYQLALAQYQLAADKGDARSQYELGVMYSEGKGVKKDKEEARKWLSLSDEQGFRDAKFALTELDVEEAPVEEGTNKFLYLCLAVLIIGVGYGSFKIRQITKNKAKA